MSLIDTANGITSDDRGNKFTKPRHQKDLRHNNILDESMRLVSANTAHSEGA